MDKLTGTAQLPPEVRSKKASGLIPFSINIISIAADVIPQAGSHITVSKSHSSDSVQTPGTASGTAGGTRTARIHSCVLF